MEHIASNGELNAITLELIVNSLQSICDEMGSVLIRSSRSLNIKERRDCSFSIYTPIGGMMVQVEHIPIHLGIMPYALKGILKQFAPEGMESGDIFIVNDPYHGGNHLPDFIVAGPLYLEGRLVAFAASMAHHNDVGGAAPRSMPATSTEIFQEGIRIPPIQIARHWKAFDDVVRLISVNSRTPDERIADLRVQLATIRLAQQRMEELGTKYPASVLLSALTRLANLSEQAMRRRLIALPDGEWHGESAADDGASLFPIHARVNKRGDGLLVDFTGTAPQTGGPFNSNLSNTHAAVFIVLRIMLASDIPLNEGVYRPIRLIIPEGTILNPRYPAAVSAATQLSYHTVEALVRALAPLVPDAAIADSGSGGVFSFGGRDPRTGDLYAIGGALAGGMGATASLDGESAAQHWVSGTRNTPAETLEMTLPVRLERYELVEGSGGAGTHRGGLGIRHVFRMLAPATCSFQVSMSRRPPAGLEGGRPGAPTRITITRSAGSKTAITMFSRYEAKENDLITIETAGGGGFGDPGARAPSLAEDDLHNGYQPAPAAKRRNVRMSRQRVRRHE